jgi:molybdopterin/thiamine biosynthesis adenylyltransferase
LEDQQEFVLILDTELLAQMRSYQADSEAEESGELKGFLSTEKNIAFILKMNVNDQEFFASSSFQKLYNREKDFDFNCPIYFDENAQIKEDLALLLVNTADSGKIYPITGFVKQQPLDNLVKTQVLNFEGDLFSRVRGIFDTNLIKDKQVAVFGLGSGGSFVSLELAKCGIDHFALFDFDRLEIQNISRHVCGLQDLGRLKTDAVADLILNVNPRASIQKFPFDIADSANRNTIIEVANQSDVLVMATDSESSRFLINEVALLTGKPLFYAGVYDRGKGGEILRIIPGETGCYGCLNESIGRLSEELIENKKIDYSVLPGESGKVEAVPGLSVDIAFVALLHTKMILTYLIRQINPDYPDIEENLIIWGNTTFPGVFDHPLVIAKITLPPHANCSVCRGTGLLPPEGTMTPIDLSQVEEVDWKKEGKA